MADLSPAMVEALRRVSARSWMYVSGVFCKGSSYEQAERLVAAGLLQRNRLGRRGGGYYLVTDAGREALAALGLKEKTDG